ncbi:hypothetical protein AK812_SmicGene41806 [Symbiodinium microadriaticum]|uniref:Uncharacterized protein n=1 Tax=Symbiodinium microadriaticum TaxID=2951 RepID=A0A1Q9C560_SYMMI|nr:hypothetical protein AK812_SmicGene41806 [Symbiodinium microadriaticum]
MQGRAIRLEDRPRADIKKAPARILNFLDAREDVRARHGLEPPRAAAVGEVNLPAPRAAKVGKPSRHRRLKRYLHVVELRG